MSSTNRCAVLSVVIVLTAGLASAQEATPTRPASQPATDRPATPTASQKASTPTTQPIKPVKLKKLVLDLGKGVKMELVLIPAGKFMMGSPDNEQDRASEGPQHLVTIGKPFYLGIYHVTQEQYQAIMGNNPSRFKEESSQPVDSVTWNNAQEFCKMLSANTQKKVRLPSEAEWEYACRAGTTTRFYYGDDPDYDQLSEYAWYEYFCNDSRIHPIKSHPVGLKMPNAWGLYDMHGNVYQWCQDYYRFTYVGAPTDGSAWEKPEYSFDLHVVRGGSCEVHAPRCRSASRAEHERAGFRVVVDVPGKP